MPKEKKRVFPANYFFIGFVGLSLIGIVAFSFYSGLRINTLYPPMIDATMVVKLELTRSQLQVENILRNNRREKMDIDWSHFDRADWYLTAMLQGGENNEGKFLALDDAGLRKTVLETQKKIKVNFHRGR